MYEVYILRTGGSQTKRMTDNSRSTPKWCIMIKVDETATTIDSFGRILALRIILRHGVLYWPTFNRDICLLLAEVDNLCTLCHWKGSDNQRPVSRLWWRSYCCRYDLYIILIKTLYTKNGDIHCAMLPPYLLLRHPSFHSTPCRRLLQ